MKTPKRGNRLSSAALLLIGSLPFLAPQIADAQTAGKQPLRESPLKLQAEAAPADKSVERDARESVRSKPVVRFPGRSRAEGVDRIPLDVPQDQSATEFWETYFAKHQPGHAAVRKATRDLMQAERYPETVALIGAVLRKSQIQPWMYEALALAMKAGEFPESEIERALMSAVDYSNSVETLVYVASYMSRLGLDKQALQLYQELASLMPNRPEPFVKGLAIARDLDDIDAIQWASVGILRQAWPKAHRKIELDAIRVAKATLDRLEKEEKKAEAKSFHEALLESMARDCVVRVSWTGDADLDLMIEEPSGGVCSIRNPFSVGGGVLMGDAYARSGGESLAGYAETYICPEGFTGEYRMLIRKIWGKVTAGKVTVDIFTHFRTPQQTHIHKQIELGAKDALVIFALHEGRRDEAFETAQMTNMVAKHVDASRAVLSRQLSSSDSTAAVRDFAIARRRGLPLLPFARRGGVGYRPQITVLPEGTNLSLSNAIVSPDRRYVRIGIPPTPVFTGIGDIATFNFVSGQGGGQQGGGGGAVGGGPGGGGGGGGGGFGGGF